MISFSHGSTIEAIHSNHYSQDIVITWKLKRTAQCKQCLWRVEGDPHDIPNGYCESKHHALAAPDELPAAGEALHFMACHETDEAHCIGWLHHQMG